MAHRDAHARTDKNFLLQLLIIFCALTVAVGLLSFAPHIRALTDAESPPTVSLTAPANGATVSGNAVVVSATASDNVGVVGVQFKSEGVNIGAEDTTSPYSVLWDTTTLTNDTHFVSAYARDAAGNVTPTTRSVTVSNTGPDTTPPVLSAGSPSTAQPAGTTQVTMSVTTNENATCKYSSTAGTAYASMASTFSTTGATSHSVTVTGLSNGQSYTRYVRCQDTAGNPNTSDYTVSWSVSNTSMGGIVQTGGYLQGWAWANQGDPKGGVGYICMNDAIYCPTAGVYISNDNRTLTGYAWSDNVGWINFGLNTCNVSSTVTTDQNFNLGGWAKVVNASQAQAGGWDGCISFSSSGLGAGLNPNGTVWGVKLDGSHTYAWGSDVMGWIDFASTTGAFISQIGGDNSLTLVATPSHVLKGGNTTLSFTVGGMSSCRVTGSDGSVPYPLNVSPNGPPAKTATATITKPTTYTLLCTQTSDSSQHTGNVTVSLLGTYIEK